jgi:hypothetical protein
LAAISAEKTAYVVLFAALVCVSFSGIVTFVVIELLPLWVILVMAVLAILLILPHLLIKNRAQNQLDSKGILQKTMELAGAIALVLQYLIPWLNQLFNLKLFM